MSMVVRFVGHAGGLVNDNVDGEEPDCRDQPGEHVLWLHVLLSVEDRMTSPGVSLSSLVMDDHAHGLHPAHELPDLGPNKRLHRARVEGGRNSVAEYPPRNSYNFCSYAPSYLLQ
eukprot:3276184-Rhodomonas_salina.2